MPTRAEILQLIKQQNRTQAATLNDKEGPDQLLDVGMVNFVGITPEGWPEFLDNWVPVRELWRRGDINLRVR